MTHRGTTAIGSLAFAFCLIVLCGEGLPRLRQGDPALGWIITVCGVIGGALGLVARLILASRRWQRRQEAGGPDESV